MIIDTSNAPCGPGFLPGLRLSERRFAINRRPPRLRGWGSRRRPSGTAFVPPSADRPGCPVRRVVPAWEPHPPARELSRPLCHSIPDPGRGGAPPRRARTSGRGCRWTFTRLRADRVARAPKGPTDEDRSSGWLRGLPRVERAAGLSGARRHSPRPGEKNTTAHVSLSPGSHKCSAPHPRKGGGGARPFEYDLRSDETTR